MQSALLVAAVVPESVALPESVVVRRIGSFDRRILPAQ